MVPNVYGMSQSADGGLMSTKPYISGSSYILKMSDYKKRDWCSIWDALFWNFINNHKVFFKKNPRMRMLVSSFEKMNLEKKKSLIEISANFIENLK
jgi:deoxyribodipyrimidine photolyase-related protein